MSYFKNYPKIRYPFGGQSSTSITQDIGVYIDLVDRAKDDGAFYTEYSIKNGDRPDTVSQDLYGTPDYYWTFFLMNDDIKLRGWPLSNQAITKKAKEEYPHQVLVTRESMTGRFQLGDIIRGLNSGAHGEIIRRRPDMGQIIIKLIPNPDPGPNESTTAILQFENDEDAESIRIVIDANDEITGSPSMKIDRVIDEYNSKDHYENAEGDHVDVFPRAPYVQRFHIPITYSPTNYYYINPTADLTSGNLTNLAIYFDPTSATSATNPVPDSTIIAGIVAAEQLILVPQLTAYGTVPALTTALVAVGQMTSLEKATYDGAAAIGQLTLQSLAEQIALATSATSVSPLKNFEVNTTTYAIEDTSNPADGVITAGSWLFDLDTGITLSTFDNLDLDLTLSEANAVSLLGNLLPGANILVLLFTALQLVTQKQQTGLPISLGEFNLLFTSVLRQTVADPNYVAAIQNAFLEIITYNLPKYQTSASSVAADIPLNRIKAEFDYFFLVDKLIDIAGGASSDNIGTLIKYSADDYTTAAANVATQTATFQGIATAGGHSTVATYAPTLVALSILTQAQSDAYVAAEALGQLNLSTLIGQLAFGAAIAANPPTEKTFYKVFYGPANIPGSSSSSITIINQSGAFEAVTITDTASKDDAYDELKTRFDSYITSNYDDLEPAILTPVTYLEKYVRQNNTLKTIKVLKPEVVREFDAQFRKILGESLSEEIISTSASSGVSAYTAVPDTNVAVSSTSSSSSSGY